MQRIFGARVAGGGADAPASSGAAAPFGIGVIYAMVALTAIAVLGLTTENGPILFQLLDDYAPPLLAILVLSGIVAASFSTASGAILATSAVAVRNLFGVRRVVVTEAGAAIRCCVWTRLAMIPICRARRDHRHQGQPDRHPADPGLRPHARRASPGRSSSACSGSAAARARPSRRSSSASRSACVLFVLTPTMYGVPNDLLVHPERPDRRVVRRLADVLGLRRLVDRLPGRRGDLAAHRDRGGLVHRGRHARRDDPGAPRARARRLTDPAHGPAPVVSGAGPFRWP